MGPTPEQMHALYCQALGRVAALGPGGCTERVGPWLCIDAGLGVSKFNIAVVVDHVSRPRPALHEAMEWFAMRGINARLDLRGRVDGAILAASMVEGFTFWGREPAMELHPLPPAGERGTGALEIREARTPEDIALYCQADGEEYGDQEFQAAMADRARQLSGVALHLGLLEGRAVARSMSMTSGDLVGVYNVYVAPSQRKRGFGAELTVAAIEAGRARGAISACLESTEAGFSLYSSLGFRRVDDYIIVGTEGPVTV